MTDVWFFAAGGVVIGALAATGAIWWRWRRRLRHAADQAEAWLKTRVEK